MVEPESGPVLFVSTGFPPQQVGGIEQHTIEVARALRGRGVPVAFYSRGDREDLEEHATYETEFDGFRATRVIHRWSSARTIRDAFDDDDLVDVFRRYLDELKPRLVHVHHLGGLGFSCLRVIEERGIPLIMTLHDLCMMCPRGQMFHADLYACDRVTPEQCAPCIAATWPHLMPSGDGEPVDPSRGVDDVASAAALQDWQREVLAIPDLLLTAAPALRDRCVEFGIDPARIEVEEYGQDLSVFQGITRPPSDRVRFGFVGTLIPSKGLHVLLEAFARLDPGSASLLVAGNAPPFYQCTDYGERVQTLVGQVPTANPVEMLGTYDHAELPSLLARIDVLVVPPLWYEAFGLTLREGMLAGCAVLSSRTGGLTQAVREGENGFTFTPGDVDELANLMQRFVDDRGLAKRLGEAEKRVRPVENMVQSLLRTYQALGVAVGEA